MGAIAAASAAAVGAFATSAVCYCLKKSTEWEHVNFRCNVTDGNCNCGFVHDNTEVQLKIAEVEDQLRAEARLARERSEKAADDELAKAHALFQKDLELAEKQNQLEVAELERDLVERKAEVGQLTKTVEEMKNEYVRFREQVNAQLFQRLMAVQTPGGSVAVATAPTPPRQIMRPPSVPPAFTPPVQVVRR